MDKFGSYLRPDLADYRPAANLDFNNMIKERIAEGETIYHFGFGESPFPVPGPFLRGLIANAGQNEYLSVAGLLRLREKILAFHKRHGDFEHFQPDDAVLGVGSNQLIYQTMNVFGGEVLLVPPCWTTYQPQTVLCAKKHILVETSHENRFFPTGEQIEQAVAKGDPDLPKLLILNSPGNPTGMVATRDQLKEIAETCRKHQIVALSDEIYARFSFKRAHHSLAKFYPEGTIVTSGFSKWASLGGWRAGYALFPQELSRLRQAVFGAGSHTFSNQCTPIQYALQDGFDHADELEDYIQRERIVLEMAGDYTHRELTSVGVKAHVPEAAYYLMPDFEVCRSPAVSNGQEMCESLLDEANVATLPCDPHFCVKSGELTTRYAYINFKGEKAMRSVLLGGFKSNDERDAFLLHYCLPLVEGVEATKKWVLKNRKG